MKEAGSGGREDDLVVAEVLRALRDEIFSDHLLMLAAGLAYYGVVGLLPALASAAVLWGMVGNLGALRHVLGHGGGMLPQDAANVLRQFVTSVPEGFGGGLGLVFNLVVVIWIAYRQAGGLLTALNIVYDVVETRSRPWRAVVSFTVGVCGIAVLFVALALLTLAPLVSAWMEAETAVGLLWLRWPLLIILFTLGLVLLFRYAPSRNGVCWWCIGWGAAAAAAMWAAASAGVSLYVGQVASFGRLYGSLGSIAVVLLWFYASALAILTGAEIDAVLTARIERDRGSPRN